MRRGERGDRLARAVGAEAAPSDDEEKDAEPTTGVMQQDVFALPDGMEAVCGMHVPHIYFVARKGFLPSDDDYVDRRMSRELMRDFVGLERVDAKTRRALLDFSYNLTLGLVDEGACSFVLVPCHVLSCSFLLSFRAMCFLSARQRSIPRGAADRVRRRVAQDGANVRQDEAPRRRGYVPR